MKKITCTLTILLAALMAVPATVAAQDPYDDLYFSPSKEAEKKKKAEEARRKAQAEWDAKYGTPAADTYTGGSTMPRDVDVDEFNRRNPDTDDSALIGEMSGSDAFAYTRRLERYHNPDIVSASNDSTLQEYYYSTPSENDINVYVINTIDPFDYGWGASPWSWGWYNPYRYNFWGPRWSIGWGFDPWFDFSWGWGSPWYGPSWGWGSPWYGPSWGWGWGWTGGCHWHPSWGGAPLPPGGGHHGWASGPARPGFNGGRGNATGSRRPGYGITRPGSQNRPTWSGTSSASGNRPGYRPGSSARPGSSYRPSGTSSRPGSSGSYRPGSSGSNSNNNSYRPSNNSRRGNSGNSYNYNSGSSHRSSSPSWNSSGGSNNSSRGGGGGSYRGGGGGGRGRR